MGLRVPGGLMPVNPWPRLCGWAFFTPYMCDFR